MTTAPTHTYPPPADCPVCGQQLLVTRLGCGSCGTELSGRFAACPYCSLSGQDLKMLCTFLVSRGNMRELARELGVSYPTARQRFGELLVKLGLEETGEPAADRPDREDVLRRLAMGEIDLDEASGLLNLPDTQLSEPTGSLYDVAADPTLRRDTP